MSSSVRFFTLDFADLAAEYFLLDDSVLALIFLD